ncbi:sugar transporter [Pyrenophora seminiperda CCB06]|uniref:Sugar transporter n=1 Tax=Pyrenophora seminiperda CCB06 TaxID=1302712 RepID=A0A3M7M3S0_9PLEO|nr:sugar transporter [Pyrenophora seminiperda CCB06]
MSALYVFASVPTSDDRQINRLPFFLLLKLWRALIVKMFEKVPKINNVYFLAIVATMGGMLFGFDISSMSAIIPTKQYIRGMLIAGQILNGVTVGITSSQVPVYLAEISKHSQRGAIIIIQQLAIEWGILIMYFIGYGCSFISGETASFRTAWGIQYVPCVFFMIGLPFLPESPRWLAKVDRTEEAIHVLAVIQADGNIEDPYVIAEYEEIVTTLTAERLAPKGWRKFVVNGMWKRTLAGFSPNIGRTKKLPVTTNNYVTFLFAMAGLSGNINLVSSGVQYALFIIFSSIMFFFVDKIGRRTLLVWGAIAMGICHFVVGGTLGAHSKYVPEGVNGDANVVMLVHGSPAYTVIAFCYLLIIVYALTLAPICWVYAAEVWSLETRASGMGISATGNWLFNFAIGFFIPPAFVNIRWGIFIIFGVLCMLAAVQFFFTYPETCGKTLEEIEVLFSKGGPHAWQTKKGSEHLAQDVEQVAAAQAKGEARASIERVIRKEKGEAEQMEAV